MAKSTPRYDYENGQKYVVLYTGLKPPSSNYSQIRCPYCSTSFRAYWWSIAGGGKKCPGCGAMHNSLGLAYKPIKGK